MFSNSILFFVGTGLLSLLLIVFLHSCWNYIKDTYSTKKTKNIVNSQIEKYKKIVEDLQREKGSPNPAFLDNNEMDAMNQELVSFAQTLVDKPSV